MCCRACDFDLCGRCDPRALAVQTPKSSTPPSSSHLRGLPSRDWPPQDTLQQTAANNATAGASQIPPRLLSYRYSTPPNAGPHPAHPLTADLTGRDLVAPTGEVDQASAAAGPSWVAGTPVNIVFSIQRPVHLQRIEVGFFSDGENSSSSSPSSPGIQARESAGVPRAVAPSTMTIQVSSDGKSWSDPVAEATPMTDHFRSSSGGGGGRAVFSLLDAPSTPSSSSSGRRGGRGGMSTPLRRSKTQQVRRSKSQQSMHNKFGDKLYKMVASVVVEGEGGSQGVSKGVSKGEGKGES